jgi:hypothetical protein
VAKGEGFFEVTAYLSADSLSLDPLARLAEAAGNIWYVLENVGEVDDEIRHHLKTTPVHEAGHAVAHALAGHPIKYVKYGLFGINTTALGICVLDGPSHVRLVDLLNTVGITSVTKMVVGFYGGPVAELRYDPRRVASGHRQDNEEAVKLCKALDYNLGLVNRHELQEWAWREACRMFSDERIWAATMEIADRLQRSTAITSTIRGTTIHNIVERHVPGGWQWSKA